MRILLIDDNEEIAEVISFYCEATKDIDCRVVNNAQEALDSIRNEKFDLILLDLEMLGFGGRDVIKKVNEDGLIESKNIVIFTSSLDRSLVDEMKNVGIKEVFKKSSSLDDLAQFIEKYRPRT
ncbi:MAG: response regulator [Nitrososphaeraceae archaeon]